VSWDFCFESACLKRQDKRISATELMAERPKPTAIRRKVRAAEFRQAVRRRYELMRKRAEPGIPTITHHQERRREGHAR
jgi:hypothetical protein